MTPGDSWGEMTLHKSVIVQKNFKVAHFSYFSVVPDRLAL